MPCSLWYHLFNLKNVKSTQRGLILLVKLQAEACNFTKSVTPPWVLFTFFKLNKWYQTRKAFNILVVKKLHQVLFQPCCYEIFFFATKMLICEKSEVYLVPYQTSMMGHFAEISNGYQLLAVKYFRKSSIVVVWQGPHYTSGNSTTLVDK